MKIIYKQGDLLECSESAIVHGCNAQGVMGSGVAKAIKEKYPEAYDTYKSVYETKGLDLGKVLICDTGTKVIFNAITQEFYGRSVKRRYVNYSAIEKAFRMINSVCKVSGILHVALPKIGAGLANGDWNIIEKIIEKECTDVQPVVYVIGDDK